VNIHELDEQILDAVGFQLFFDGAAVHVFSRTNGRPIEVLGLGADIVYNRLTGKTQVGKAMCGIIGFLDKRGRQEYPIGKTLYGMLQALSCRGPDSAGVAVFGAKQGLLILQIKCPEPLESANVVQLILQPLQEIVVIAKHQQIGSYLCLEVEAAADPVALEERLLHRVPGCEIVSLGHQLEIVKQVGSPAQLEKAYGISQRLGSHGIGHTRLSTESRVDLSHSQPFWAHGVPDLATVHNGHITNYHKLRRLYEQQGYRFYTENDSEAIGVYLRDRMTHGMSLEDALRSSLDDFDGSFSYLAASSDMLAYVRDRYGFKPLMVAETDDFVAIATEEIALRQTLGEDFTVYEPPPGTIGIWHTQQPAFATP
jgi:glutamate synthase domain-containing protein 1